MFRRTDVAGDATLETTFAKQLLKQSETGEGYFALRSFRRDSEEGEEVRVAITSFKKAKF